MPPSFWDTRKPKQSDTKHDVSFQIQLLQIIRQNGYLNYS